MTPRIVTLGFLLLLGCALWAQTQTGEPEEPEIVLPQFVLEIEDLSIERIDAKLPPEQDLLSPERRVLLVDLDALVVEDAGVPSAILEAPKSAAASTGDRSLSSEVQLGAGSQNNIVASIDLKTLGADPRFSLAFDHETADGLSGTQAGAGFSHREEDLKGALTLKLLGNDLVASVGFSELEWGLQGKSIYTSRLSRSATGTVDFGFRPLERLTINAQLSAGSDSLILGSATPLAADEYRASPAVEIEARFDSVTLGLSTGYEFRSSAAGPFHRYNAAVSLGIALPANLLVDGSFGWHWDSGGRSVFPFSITLGGTPHPSFAFSFGAGFRVERLGLHELAVDYPWTLPVELVDNDEWFGDATFQFTILKNLNAHARVSFAAPRGMLSATYEKATGLFAPAQAAGYSLASDLSVIWGITQDISLSAGWTHEYLASSAFALRDDLRIELLGLEQSGKWGGRLSAALRVTDYARVQLPEIGVGGFIQLSDLVQLHLDIEDLLWFALGGPRGDVYPYEKQGFRIMGSITLSL